MREEASPRLRENRGEASGANGEKRHEQNVFCCAYADNAAFRDRRVRRKRRDEHDSAGQTGIGGIHVTVTDEGALHVMELKQDYSGDDYANSYHILGRSASDFILEFGYTPSRVAWNQARISFRCQSDENEWNQYMVLICGPVWARVSGASRW